MAQRTEDSTMTSLRELIQLEQDRVEEDRRVKVQAEADHRRRALEERARAEAEALRRAQEAEAAQRAEQRRAREAEAKAEAERADRELRLRLEVEHARREAEQVNRLEHARKMAELELGARRRSVSPGAAAGLVALTLAGVVGMGFWMRSQLHSTSATAAPAPIAAPSSVSPEEIARLNAQIAQSNATTDALRHQIDQLSRPQPVPAVDHHHHHPTASASSARNPADPFGALEGNGPDPINGHEM